MPRLKLTLDLLAVEAARFAQTESLHLRARLCPRLEVTTSGGIPFP